MSGIAMTYATDTVTSADGTTIGYRQLGSGPGVVLLSGGYLAAQHYMELATALSDTYTVYVPDRRGRGLSGPPGSHHGIANEREDVEALLARTHAQFLFGHSSGGLIALQAALELPAVRKVAVYEPAVAMFGTFDLSWIPRFERELDYDRPVSAIVTFIKGTGVSRGMSVLPTWLLVALLKLYLRKERKNVGPGEQSVAELLPLQRLDVQIFRETATSEGFAAMSADVLLMDGDKTHGPMRPALDALQKTLPRVTRITFDGVGHEAPLRGRGDPERVAAVLHTFFDRGREEFR